ncbi:MAG: hypothetical protein AB2A00_34385 [Myxococcota bacterium]
MTLGLLLLGASPSPGEWRLQSQHTRVKVLSWGLFCGREPRDSRGIPGAVYQLTVQGNDVTLTGAGKTLSTRACGLDPPQFKPRQTQHDGDRISVECEAPPVAGTPVVTQHRFELRSSTELRYVTEGEKRDRQNLDACRYAYTTEMVFVAARQDDPCAKPGAPVKLVLDPPTSDVEPGNQVCFKVQAMDAQGCAVSSGKPAFTVEPAGVATVEGSCLRAPAKVASTMVLGITATLESATGNAAVRVATKGERIKESFAESARRSGHRINKLVSEVMAGEFVIKTPQEEDEGAPAPVAAAAPVSPTTTPATDGTPTWMWLAGGAVGLMLLSVVGWLMTRRRKPSDDVDGPISVPPATVAPAKPPEAGKGYKCPKCGFEYERPGKCIHDGTELVLNTESGRKTMFIPQVGGMICPTCGQRFPSRARFCGNDRSPLLPDFNAPPPKSE